jgi:hypothetical protein
MNPIILIGAIGLLAVGWHIVISIMIYDVLKKRGVKVNFLLLRASIIHHISEYKDISLKETGKVGPLFYHWIISINIALVSVILLLFLRVF